MTQTGTDTVYQPWRFAGSYYDQDAGLYKMGVRYYDPSLYRFTQMDPVKGNIYNPIMLNPYQYAGCNPLNNSDASGMFFEELREALLEDFLGDLVGGSVAAACWGVANYFTAGVAMEAATWGCSALGG